MDEYKRGSLVISDTNKHFGRFGMIYALEDTVISALDGNAAGADGMPLPVRGKICGSFNAITLASGSVIAYHLPGGELFVLEPDASALVAGEVGAAYSQDIICAGATEILLSSGSLPPGLELTVNEDGSATLAGEPTEAGTFEFSLLATNPQGQVGIVEVSIEIAAAGE